MGGLRCWWIRVGLVFEWWAAVFPFKGGQAVLAIQPQTIEEEWSIKDYGGALTVGFLDAAGAAGAAAMVDKSSSHTIEDLVFVSKEAEPREVRPVVHVASAKRRKLQSPSSGRRDDSISGKNKDSSEELAEETTAAGETGMPGTIAAGVLSGIAMVAMAVVLLDELYSNGKARRIGTRTGRTASSSTGRLAANDSGMGNSPNPPPAGSEHFVGNASQRRPSASIGLLVMAQLQFLATLAHVDSVVESDSWLPDVVVGLRWVNLWWRADFAEGVLYNDCNFHFGTADIGAAVFVGNLTLIAGFTLGIFLLHITLVSALEAFWMTKAPGGARYAEARRRGAWIGDPRTKDLGEHKADEEGGDPPAPAPRERESQYEGAIERCRDISDSAWLYYPHVELLFLLFAFEGSVASQVAVIRGSSCPGLVFAAFAALFLYPVLLLLLLSRIILVHVRSNIPIYFQPARSDTATPSESPGVIASTRLDWRRKERLFSWANTGQWRTISTSDNAELRKRDNFRRGFEPVFVDYSERGSWFMLVNLFQWTAIACIGVLIDDSVLQLFFFCGVYAVFVIVLAKLEPYANSMVNGIAVFLAGMNVATSGLLATAELVYEDRSEEEAIISNAVISMQILALGLLVILVYVDAVSILVGIARRATQKARPEMDNDRREGQDLVSSYARRNWARSWCVLLRLNMVASARDVREGVRAPRSRRVADGGSSGTLASFGGTQQGQARPSSLPKFGDSGVACTPIVVRSGRLNTIGLRASSWRTVQTPGCSSAPLPRRGIDGLRWEPLNRNHGGGMGCRISRSLSDIGLRTDNNRKEHAPEGSSRRGSGEQVAGLPSEAYCRSGRELVRQGFFASGQSGADDGRSDVLNSPDARRPATSGDDCGVQDRSLRGWQNSLFVSSGDELDFRSNQGSEGGLPLPDEQRPARDGSEKLLSSPARKLDANEPESISRLRAVIVSVLRRSRSPPSNENEVLPQYSKSAMEYHDAVEAAKVNDSQAMRLSAGDTRFGKLHAGGIVHGEKLLHHRQDEEVASGDLSPAKKTERKHFASSAAFAGRIPRTSGALHSGLVPTIQYESSAVNNYAENVGEEGQMVAAGARPRGGSGNRAWHDSGNSSGKTLLYHRDKSVKGRALEFFPVTPARRDGTSELEDRIVVF